MSTPTLLGKVAVTPNGEWSGESGYEPLDIVTNEGNGYISLQSVPAGVPLSNTSYWLKFCEKGDTGEGGKIISSTASVDSSYGTPSVTVTLGGTAHERSFAFAFSNLKGNGIVSVEKTSTSGSTDTYTITYDSGETTSFTVTNGSVTSVNGRNGNVTGLAEQNGYYTSLTSGNAEQLISTLSVNDTQPYLFRTSGGDKDIGNREFDKLIGCTVCWNQLVDTNTSSVTLADGHKYYLPVDGVYTICNGDGTSYAVSSGDVVIDLTRMFGFTVADHIYTLEQGNPGSGKALLYPFIEYADMSYNAGELVSVKASSHETTGLNQWDEEWEVGSYTNGEKVSSSSRIRSKNHIPVIPDTTYYLYLPETYTSWLSINEYDANKSYIKTTSKAARSTIKLSADTHYINFNTSNDYGNVYKNDICINISWSGYRNGEYEAYVKHTYPLDTSLELRGSVNVNAERKLGYKGDEYTNDGTVKRKYGIVDMGTLIWTKGNGVFYAVISERKPHGRLICDQYPESSNKITGGDKYMYSTYGNDFYIYDSEKTSSMNANQFKTAMSGKYLVYELDSETTENAETYTNPQIADDFGTERYVDTRSVPLPVGHDTDYPANLRDKLQRLPDMPDEEGFCIVKYSSRSSSFMPISGSLDNDGSYTLSCTVTNGIPAFSWKSC